MSISGAVSRGRRDPGIVAGVVLAGLMWLSTLLAAVPAVDAWVVRASRTVPYLPSHAMGYFGSLTYVDLWVVVSLVLKTGVLFSVTLALVRVAVRGVPRSGGAAVFLSAWMAALVGSVAGAVAGALLWSVDPSITGVVHPAAFVDAVTYGLGAGALWGWIPALAVRTVWRDGVGSGLDAGGTRVPPFRISGKGRIG
ncbi:hypothetical protein [Nocardioides sp. NPDC006273]|uniref:hypothetical protein n=1 Tax=Nocardioides sp. NPDC006273 TaxID=3155598 RepID=UPI0033B89B9A